MGGSGLDVAEVGVGGLRPIQVDLWQGVVGAHMAGGWGCDCLLAAQSSNAYSHAAQRELCKSTALLPTDCQPGKSETGTLPCAWSPHAPPPHPNRRRHTSGELQGVSGQRGLEAAWTRCGAASRSGEAQGTEGRPLPATWPGGRMAAWVAQAWACSGSPIYGGHTSTARRQSGVAVAVAPGTLQQEELFHRDPVLGVERYDLHSTRLGHVAPGRRGRGAQAGGQPGPTGRSP